MKFLALFAILAVTACGVDGPPERPVEKNPNLSISGHATVGAVTEL
ncbi:hypothetical protein [Paracoccus saliphilus]|uniref:Uncharacterized protein n=1 Tax=Paracoccus saliphilus TaxID=405559 RepID=A0AA45W6Q4_9RHOB|nr:hypothetical protein [Paracoccus saliphilus]WCR02851.1 hypothetical protein JHX88_18855 [Paracoccus saliphilus]SIT03713.1 hypothetical protein SAMN05421772_11389 [Paracoccus saliphilus]